jgi:hypothetical protein
MMRIDSGLVEPREKIAMHVLLRRVWPFISFCCAGLSELISSRRRALRVGNRNWLFSAQDRDSQI